MNRLLVLFCGFLLLTPLYTHANVKLIEVNNIVEQKAQQLDKDHGLLMTATERDNYKIKVIAEKLIEKKAANPSLTINDLVNEGEATYEVNDSYEQRQLFFELEIMGNGDGVDPPK